MAKTHPYDHSAVRLSFGRSAEPSAYAYKAEDGELQIWRTEPGQAAECIYQLSPETPHADPWTANARPDEIARYTDLAAAAATLLAPGAHLSPEEI